MVTGRIRWECPNGKHPGKLGLRQPRKDATIRYCLPCSEAEGRLVLRVAPALERARAAGAERSKAKQARKRAAVSTERERRREWTRQRYTFEGVDLNKELARLCRLKAFGGRSGRLALRRPRFDITMRNERHPRRHGFASPDQWRIHINRWPGQDFPQIAEILIHELTHLSVGGDPADRATWHGEKFKTTMRLAFKEAYGPNVVAVPNRFVGRFAAALRKQRTEVAS